MSNELETYVKLKHFSSNDLEEIIKSLPRGVHEKLYSYFYGPYESRRFTLTSEFIANQMVYVFLHKVPYNPKDLLLEKTLEYYSEEHDNIRHD